MKRLVIVLGLAAVAFLAIGQLADLTQSRPDPIRDGEVTELVMEVDVDRFRPGRDAAASALWAVCSAQTGSRVVGGSGPEVVGAGQYRVVLAPAVGHHDERKLVGCLEDLTVDRVLGDVTVFRTLAASG